MRTLASLSSPMAYPVSHVVTHCPTVLSKAVAENYENLDLELLWAWEPTCTEMFMVFVEDQSSLYSYGKQMELVRQKLGYLPRIDVSASGIRVDYLWLGNLANLELLYTNCMITHPYLGVDQFQELNVFTIPGRLKALFCDLL
ncbi:hypothetical protein Gohar_014800 [Gossypium harknessii]|uniref:Uncharacterized protein n=1 Tax=Gossypium harknessii TaxID=34285 RepID=A0A7J9FXY1_9ROSI|nr:hypothetical protein [Gossypium harknessii]